MNEQEAIKIMEVVKQFIRYEQSDTDVTEYGEACNLAIQALKNEARRKELIEWYNSTEDHGA